MSEAQAETLNFQTEAKQLLQLMIHSLYSNREIFLRELMLRTPLINCAFRPLSSRNCWVTTVNCVLM